MDFCRQRGWLAPKMAGLTPKCGVSAGPGREAAHAVVDFLRRAIPVDATVFFFEDRSDGGFGMVLRTRNNRAGSEAAQRLFHEGCTSFGHSRGQFGSSLVWSDFHFALKKSVASVHARINAHGCEAGARLAGHNGSVDGSSATILGEKRSVQIDPALFRNGKKARGDNLSIRDDHDDVRGKPFEQQLN